MVDSTPSAPKIQIMNLIFLFFSILFIQAALFFIYAPYGWICDLFQMSEDTCKFPKWSILAIGIGLFTLSYFCRYNFNIKEMFGK